MRMSIWIRPDERDLLGDLARAQRRGLREQAEYMLSRELARESRKRQANSGRSLPAQPGREVVAA